MATQKVNIPSSAIFQSDPEEQIYARGTLDRDMSGFAYMFKNAAEQRRQGDQATYLQGVSEANKLASALAQQENKQAMLIEAMKLVPDYAKAGVPIAQFPALAATSATGGTDEQTMRASLLVNLLKESEIAKNAAAAAAGHGGAVEGSKDKYENLYGTFGVDPEVKGTFVGPGAQARAEADAKRMKAAREARAKDAKNGKTNPIVQQQYENRLKFEGQ